jgi:peptide/nickel transport system permease protein
MRYLVRRLLEAAVVVFAVSSLIFILLHLMPGGPCAVVAPSWPPSETGVASSSAPPAPTYVSCVDYFHLDRPVVNQYLDFVGSYLHGDLGTSLEMGDPSVQIILLDHLPATVLLLTTSFIVQQLVALPLGMFATVRRYSFFDGLFSILSYVFLSVPPFILGMVLIYFFAVEWHLLPPQRTSEVTLPVFGTGDWFGMMVQHPALLLGDLASHLVLPATTLAVIGIALDSRFMRAAMLQVLDEDYMRTAKARGVKPWRLIFKHAFRNALPPIITNIPLYFPAMIGSAMVVETVFTYTRR